VTNGRQDEKCAPIQEPWRDKSHSHSIMRKGSTRVGPTPFESTLDRFWDVECEAEAHQNGNVELAGTGPWPTNSSFLRVAMNLSMRSRAEYCPKRAARACFRSTSGMALCCASGARASLSRTGATARSGDAGAREQTAKPQERVPSSIQYG
jgi:hypothetical protein